MTGNGGNSVAERLKALPDGPTGGETDMLGVGAASPWAIPLAGWRQVAWRTWQESGTDNVGLVSAGVAFYGFLAVLPLLAATILTYGIFVDPQTVIRHMQDLTAVLPEAAAIAVGEQLLRLSASPDERKGLGILISLGIALFGARNGAGAIITALNIAYEEDEKRGFIRLSLTAIALTAAAVVGAVIAATALALVATLNTLLPQLGGFMRFVTTALTYLVLTGAGVAAATVLYRFGPSRRAARWRWLTPGAILAAIGWLILTFGFGAYAQYVGRFDTTYGPLGAIVALLTWLYLSSYVLLLGAELNAELEHQTAHDTTRGREKPMGGRGAWVADHVAGGRAPVAREVATQQKVIPAPFGQRDAAAAGRASTSNRLAIVASAGFVLAAAVSVVREVRR